MVIGMSKEFKIPPEKWYDVFDRFTSIDERIGVVIEQLNTIIKLLSGKPISVATERVVEEPVVVRPVYADSYNVYTIDLSVEHSDMPLGLRDNNIIAVSMTILRADSSFSYKLNSKASESLPGEVGSGFDDFLIREIYISNSAASGVAEILITYPRGGV